MIARYALGAALLGAAICGGGCGGEPPKPEAAVRYANFVDVIDGEDVLDVVIWKDKKLIDEAFVLSVNERVEVLASDQATDPETEKLVQVFQVKHEKGTGWVESRYIRR